MTPPKILSETIDPCPGVYQIRNTLNGKIYLGGTVNLLRRYAKHFRDLCAQKHHSQRFQRAWLKYGESAFVFEVLEVTTREKVQGKEQYWLDTLQPYLKDQGYNICKEGRLRIGISPSPETRLKMSAAQKGRKLSPERVAQMRQNSLGKRHTEETKRRIGTASSLRSQTPEAKIKIGAAHRGKMVSPETRLKIGLANKGHQTWLGRKHSEASKLKMRSKVFSEERKEKMRQKMCQRWEDDDGTLRSKISAAVSARHKGKIVSEETREKMKTGMRAAWQKRKTQKEEEKRCP